LLINSGWQLNFTSALPLSLFLTANGTHRGARLCWRRLLLALCMDIVCLLIIFCAERTTLLCAAARAVPGFVTLANSIILPPPLSNKTNPYNINDFVAPTTHN
jgi:hypothetical protein